ncbi:MAG: T9SS type A sorting domain-containing protein [Bacteroidetes bacterium]|nr:T9SS type A sorting domain-containing protein [Bacteroidota bacterium]
MKKHLLLGLASTISIGLSAQSNVKQAILKNAVPVNAAENLSDRYAGIEPAQSTVKPITNKVKKTNSTSAAGAWTMIGGSSNMFGVLVSNQRPLQYDANTNALSFIHRKSASYAAVPASNSGAIVAEINHPFGSSTWDSTCVWSDANNWGRYPQGGIYSVGISSLANAYVTVSGMITVAAGGWQGNFFGSKQLNTFDATASSAPGAMQFLSNASPFAPTGIKGDFSRSYQTVTSDGKLRFIGIYAKNVNNTSSNSAFGLTGFTVYRGTFAAGTFTFAADTFNFSGLTKKAADSSYSFSSQPYMAWNSSGTVGYIVALGQSAFTGSLAGVNNGWQPIIYKTTNSGSTWNVASGIDFSTPTFSNVLEHIYPVATNTALIIPRFNDGEGVDVMVDANDKLHIFTSVIGMYSSNPDSAGYVTTFSVGSSGSGCYWRHTTGEQPYLYDFVGDGASAWNYVTVDSMSTERAATSSGRGGYNQNPWDVQSGSKIGSGARLQMTKTVDGNNIIYTWAESDTNNTTLGVKWNVLPDLKARIATLNSSSPTGYKVWGGTSLNPSANKTNLTGVDPNVSNNAWFHYASPLTVNAYTTPISVTYTLPTTVTFNSSYLQNNNSTHWYSANTASATVGINENSQTQAIASLNVYPNPAKNEAFVKVTLNNSSNLTIQVLNALGQVVKSSSVQAFVGSNTLNVDLQGINSGIYFVKVSDGTHASTTKLIVE